MLWNWLVHEIDIPFQWHPLYYMIIKNVLPHYLTWIEESQKLLQPTEIAPGERIQRYLWSYSIVSLSESSTAKSFSISLSSSRPTNLEKTVIKQLLVENWNNDNVCFCLFLPNCLFICPFVGSLSGLFVCLSICLPDCLSLCHTICISVCQLLLRRFPATLSVSPFICLSNFPFVCLPALLSCLPTCLLARVPICQPTCLPVCLSACHLICLTACFFCSCFLIWLLPNCLSVYQSVCLAVCLFLIVKWF